MAWLWNHLLRDCYERLMLCRMPYQWAARAPAKKSLQTRTSVMRHTRNLPIIKRRSFDGCPRDADATMTMETHRFRT